MIHGVIRELILPPASLFLLFGLGMLLRLRFPRTGQSVCVGALTLLVFLSTGIGARMLVSPLERLTQAVSAPEKAGAQAIVVLAAGRYSAAPEYGGEEIPDYIALARLRYAAKLHRETRLPILASGGNGSDDGVFQPKAKTMASALREEFGISVAWIETDSANTAENALFSARMLKRDNVTRILLVTDAMHMRRSAMAFAEQGMDVVAAPTIFFSAGKATWMDLLPNAEHLRRSYYACYEWIGLGWYWLRYSTVPAWPAE